MNHTPLQTAYIRQSLDFANNTWIVFNEQGEKIGELPSEQLAHKAMSYLHFARPFELEALNEGIRQGKQFEIKKTNKMSQILKNMQNKIEDLEAKNTELYAQLEKSIIEGA